MKKDIVKVITSNAVVAAIYFLLCFTTASLSFGPIQVRVAEFLVLLCFLRRDYTLGVTLGCLLANLLSISAGLGALDLIFGTLATFLSCVFVSYCKHLLLATFIPVVINGFVIGLEFYLILEKGFWISCGTVLLGEFVAVTIIGYLIMILLGKRPFFQKAIRANQNQNFVW